MDVFVGADADTAKLVGDSWKEATAKKGSKIFGIGS
jgi:hypothetical protein